MRGTFTFGCGQPWYPSAADTDDDAPITAAAIESHFAVKRYKTLQESLREAFLRVLPFQLP